VQRKALPAAADEQLDDAQRTYLAALASALEAAAWDGESVQAAIFDTAKAHELPAGLAFTALYLAFLGRSSGPRAGWLLAALERDFVIGRLREAATAGVRA
jgi:lysyl-tRNA synthetase class 1